MVADGSHIPASVSRNSWIDVEEEVIKDISLPSGSEKPAGMWKNLGDTGGALP